jgi:site-specific recombinase XerD
LATFAVAGIVRRRGAAIGLVISPHDIRRAMATHLLKAGASLAHVKQLLGHADFSHLKAYLCLAPVDVQAMHRKSALNR